jgi:hypothetical protein
MLTFTARVSINLLGFSKHGALAIFPNYSSSRYPSINSRILPSGSRKNTSRLPGITALKSITRSGSMPSPRNASMAGSRFGTSKARCLDPIACSPPSWFIVFAESVGKSSNRKEPNLSMINSFGLPALNVRERLKPKCFE